jgi:hypothetical protein
MKNLISFLVVTFFILLNKETNLCNAQITAKFKGIAVPLTGVCEGEEKIKLEHITAIANPDYSWEGPSGFKSILQNPEIETKLTSNGTYTVTIKDKTAVAAGVVPIAPIIASFSIIIKPKPSGIKTDYDITGKAVTLFALGGQPNYTYTWTSPAGKSSNNKVFENLNTPIDELGVYKLVVTNPDPANGCTAEFKTDITKSKDEKPSQPVFGTSQDEEEDKVNNYIFSDRDCELSECDINGKITEDETTPSYPNCKFTLIGERDDYVIIKCWKYRDENSEGFKKFNKDYGKGQRYFRLSRNDFLSKTSKFRSALFKEARGRFIKSLDFTAGTLFSPIKLRCNPKFEFSKDITIGTFVGIRTRLSPLKPHFFSFGLGLGISAITLNSGNVVDSISVNGKQILNPKASKNPQDVPAFSWALGGIFEFNKIQIGLLWGRDRISDYSDPGWIFQNKTWFSIGFGYAILSRPPSKTDNKAGSN